MGWIVLLGLLLVFGLPVALAAMGVALLLWLAPAVAGAVWGLLTFVLGSPVLGVLPGVGIGLAIGRAMAPPRPGR